MSDEGSVDAAARALEEDAGCRPERAHALVKAVGAAAATEALDVVAGSAQSFGSAVDRRVATLDRLITELAPKESLPTVYEVGVIFRITPSQARNVLRTYQARFSARYRGRLQDALTAVQAQTKQRDGTGVFTFDFDDPAVLDYALERLRRRGLTRSVTLDRTKLQIEVERDETDRFGKKADAALKT